MTSFRFIVLTNTTKQHNKYTIFAYNSNILSNLESDTVLAYSSDTLLAYIITSLLSDNDTLLSYNSYTTEIRYQLQQ